jgi:hypothetical protein
MEVTHIAQDPNSRYATLVLVRTKAIRVDTAGLRPSAAWECETGLHKKT